MIMAKNYDIYGNPEDIMKATKLLDKFQGKTKNYWHSRFIQRMIHQLERIYNCQVIESECEKDDYHQWKQP